MKKATSRRSTNTSTSTSTTITSTSERTASTGSSSTCSRFSVRVPSLLLLTSCVLSVCVCLLFPTRTLFSDGRPLDSTQRSLFSHGSRAFRKDGGTGPPAADDAGGGGAAGGRGHAEGHRHRLGRRDYRQRDLQVAAPLLRVRSALH